MCYGDVKAQCYAALCYPTEMDTQGDRLRWGRIRAGHQTIADAARATRMHPQNWADHEANRRGISPANAKAYQKHLKIDAGWLLTGQGSPDARTIPLMGYVGAGAVVYRYKSDEIEEITAPVGSEEGDVAFIIRGGSMSPFREGGVLIVKPVSNPADALYRLVVVDLADGRTLFKRLLPSAANGCFNLLSLTDPNDVISDVVVSACAKFRVYIDPE